MISLLSCVNPLSTLAPTQGSARHIFQSVKCCFCTCFPRFLLAHLVTPVLSHTSCQHTPAALGVVCLTLIVAYIHCCSHLTTEDAMALSTITLFMASYCDQCPYTVRIYCLTGSACVAVKEYHMFSGCRIVHCYVMCTQTNVPMPVLQ